MHTVPGVHFGLKRKRMGPLDRLRHKRGEYIKADLIKMDRIVGI
jgi:hypothetical protein